MTVRFAALRVHTAFSRQGQMDAGGMEAHQRLIAAIKNEPDGETLFKDAPDTLRMLLSRHYSSEEEVSPSETPNPESDVYEASFGSPELPKPYRDENESYPSWDTTLGELRYEPQQAARRLLDVIRDFSDRINRQRARVAQENALLLADFFRGPDASPD